MQIARPPRAASLVSLLAFGIFSATCLAPTAARAQVVFAGCGTLQQGFECMVLISDATGEYYQIQNFGGFGHGDFVYVTGDVDPFCLSFCFIDCIVNNTIELCSTTPPPFVRADVNADGSFNIADPVSLLTQLFVPGTKASDCADSVDANDDGALDIADAIFMLSALFAGGPSPASPHPTCGDDGTTDGLDCVEFAACP
ncbi:MAG: hypothetical protein ACKVX7_09485 [Planctomycetota bacterium]